MPAWCLAASSCVGVGSAPAAPSPAPVPSRSSTVTVMVLARRVERSASFCWTSATPEPEDAERSSSSTLATAVTATSWRGIGLRLRRRLSHQRRTSRRRIGVSIIRYDTSVSGTVTSIATTNCCELSGLPATLRMTWYTGQWNRYSPYERVPTHTSRRIRQHAAR